MQALLCPVVTCVSSLLVMQGNCWDVSSSRPAATPPGSRRRQQLRQVSVARAGPALGSDLPGGGAGNTHVKCRQGGTEPLPLPFLLTLPSRFTTQENRLGKRCRCRMVQLPSPQFPIFT